MYCWSVHRSPYLTSNPAPTSKGRLFNNGIDVQIAENVIFQDLTVKPLQEPNCPDQCSPDFGSYRRGARTPLRPKHFYPIQLHAVLADTYQVATKMGHQLDSLAGKGSSPVLNPFTT